MGSSGYNASANSILNINNDTDATTTSDGSLQTNGGYQLLKVFIMERTFSIFGVVTMGSSGSVACADGILNINSDTDATNAGDGYYKR